MKPQELRIGNLIKYDNRFFEIDVIADQFPTLNTSEFGIGVVDWNNIEPIPLTEEWHNKFCVSKNGFNKFVYEITRKYNSDIKIIFSQGCIMLRQGNEDKNNPAEGLIVIWNKYIAKRDIYVHEWQNLYFALSGEELTLKKEE